MADYWLTFQKTPDEIKIRGPDLTDWLQTGETIETLTVKVEEAVPVEVLTLDLSANPTLLDVVLRGGGLASDQTTTLTLNDNYDRVQVLLLDDDVVQDLTSTMVDGTPYLSDNKIHAAFKGGVVGHDYIITYEWTTSAGRKEEAFALMQVRTLASP